MKLIPEWLLSAISDGDGHTSSGRLIAVSITITCILMPATLLFWLSALANKFVEVPASVTTFMGAAGTLAVLLYGITKIKE